MEVAGNVNGLLLASSFEIDQWSERIATCFLHRIRHGNRQEGVADVDSIIHQPLYQFGCRYMPPILNRVIKTLLGKQVDHRAEVAREPRTRMLENNIAELTRYC